MSASLESMERSFSDQLTAFDQKIKAQEDNASLLNEVHSAITQLLAQAGDREEDIREILQKRYNAGKLRLETFQLVRNVLDRVVIESMATMPDAIDQTDEEESVGDATVVVGTGPEEGNQHRKLQVGSVLRDRFLLQQRVAGGSMGVVYKAHDRRLAEAEGFDPWVAIKVLSPKLSRNAYALRALQQEAAKGRCLSHPNIVRFIDLDRDDDIYFIVMEWLEGRSLAAILDENRNKKIDLTTALDIVRQVAQALDYAHRCGVIHADVKPANIMLTSTGQVKLFDFGIARIRHQQDRRHDFDPGVLGAVTPAYSSAQVLRGEDPVPADDVYSLGCLMYRMVAGHRAFGPRNAVEAADEGMEPQRPQDLADQQWRALKQSLAFSRRDRLATPAEFLEALDAEEERDTLIGGLFGERILVEPKRFVTTRRPPWGIAAGLVVLVAAAALFVLRPELLQRAQMAGSSLFDRQEPAGEAVVQESGEVTGVQEPPATVDAREPSAATDVNEPPATSAGAESPGGVETTEPPATAGAVDPSAALGTDELPIADDMQTPPVAGDPAEGAAPEDGLETLPPVGDSEVTAAGDAGAGDGQPVPEAARQEPSGPPAPAEDTAAAAAAATDEVVGYQALPGGQDQQAFEAGLPQDSVGFTVSSMQVRESEPAVQVDVIRLNPSPRELYVVYTISGGTAMEGEDYFLPITTGLVFAPGQRSARLLIPLVQDSTLESDETFSLQLRGSVEVPQANLYPRIQVVIRDDDGAY